MNKFRAYDGMFLNSKILFVEYIDIIRAPYLIFAKLLSESRKENGGLRPPFDISRIQGIDNERLIEWYYLRNYQNVLLNLIPEELMDSLRTSDIDHFLDKQIRETPNLVSVAFPLNFSKVIEAIYSMDTSLVDKTLIYYPYDNSIIREDIIKLYEGKPIEFVYGEMSEIIRNFPDAGVTYVFSDITNIQILAEADKLNTASILLPYEYAYNRLPNSLEFKIDINGYLKEYLFKMDYFFATTEYLEKYN